MNNFNEILRNTLSAVNKAFKEAQKDLSEISEKISAAVRENAGEEFDVVMRQIQSDVDGVLYRFFFDTDVNNDYADVVNITYVHIPASGYPISCGTYSHKEKEYMKQKTLNDKEELEKYFADFLEAPESPLIQAIGYVLRNKGND